MIEKVYYRTGTDDKSYLCKSDTVSLNYLGGGINRVE